MGAPRGSCSHQNDKRTQHYSLRRKYITYTVHRCQNVTRSLYSVKNEFNISCIMSVDGPRFYNTVRSPRNLRRKLDSRKSHNTQCYRWQLRSRAQTRNPFHPSRERTEQVRPRANASDLYLQGTGFGSRLKHLLPWPRFCAAFLSPSSQMTG
jgi:hypothetical protein